jgi:magnesium transporter
MAESEINKEFIIEVRQALLSRDSRFLNDRVSSLHPADIAEILDIVNMEEAKTIYRGLHEEKQADVLAELEEDVRERFLAALSPKEIAEQVDLLETDDAVDLLADLPERKQEQVIAQLEDKEHAEDIVQLLQFEEGTAGALMGTELVKVNVNWTVNTAVKSMRKQGEEVEDVYTVYVVGDDDTLKGALSFKRLFFSASSMQNMIADLYNDAPLETVTPGTSDEEVVSIMKKYDLVVIPVVDEANKLLGRITIDDVVDVMQEEAEKDYAMASGITEKVESDDSVWLLTRARLPWLLIGLVGGVLVAMVIAQYEHQLTVDPKMAFFIPLIAAMGGNVGVQSSAIVVQGLANQSIQMATMAGRLLKELGVGLVNGAICAGLILVFNMLTSDSMALSYTVSIALFAVIIFAGLFGTFTPLVLDRLKIDPALATGPFITTMNDIIGLLIYFYVGMLMYEMYPLT